MKVQPTKIIASTIALFVLSAVIIYGESLSLAFFTAESNGDDIVIEWRTLDEQNFLTFVIERKRASEETFRVVGEVKPNGFPSTYRFVDTDAFLRNSSKQQTSSNSIYQYRLKVIRQSNLSPLYSDVISVIHTVSSFRRTWGMIKELFR